VAKEVEIKDRLENMAHRWSRGRLQDLGRGWRRHTTATVLAQAIYREGIKNVTPAPTRWSSSAASTLPREERLTS